MNRKSRSEAGFALIIALLSLMLLTFLGLTLADDDLDRAADRHQLPVGPAGALQRGGGHRRRARDPASAWATGSSSCPTRGPLTWDPSHR